MRKTFWLAYNTALEILRQRLLYTVLFFGISLIFIGGILDTAAPGQSGIMVVDIGLGAIHLFGVMISIVMGVNLLFQELDRKTVYNILAKPISRTQFVIGKYFGQVAAIFLVVLGMVLCFLLLLIPHGGVSLLLWQALWTLFLELCMISAIAMVFSAFSTPYLAGLFTLGIWIVGSAANAIRNFQTVKMLRPYQSLVEAVFFILPDFSKLNLKDRVPYGLYTPEGYVTQISLYAVLYAAALLLLATGIFKRRDFK